MATTTASPAPARPPAPVDLPAPIRRAVASVGRRLRAGLALRGLGRALTVAAVGLAAGVAFEVARPWPAAARWAAWGVYVGAVGLTLVPALVRVGRRAVRPVELAAVLERACPELGERLTGAVGLLADPRGAHGSPALVAALADDAAARVAAVSPARAVPLRRAWRTLGLGLAALALVAAPAAVRPDPFARLARRFLMPWERSERVGLVEVSVRPGDAVAALGEPFRVSAVVAPRFGVGSTPGSAVLEWTDAASGRVRRVAMEADADAPAGRSRAFHAVLPRLSGSGAYRVVAGTTGESRRHRVTALPPPSVASLAVRVVPPAYTGQPTRDLRDPSRVEVWEESTVTLTFTADRALTSAEVEWPAAGGRGGTEGPRTEGREPISETPSPQPSPRGRGEGASEGPSAEGREPISEAPSPQPSPRTRGEGAGGRQATRHRARLAADGKTATVTLPAEVSGEFSFALRDTYGIAGRTDLPRRLTVRVDQPPTLALRGVEGLDEAKGDDTLRVGVTARDDLAVASVELHYQIERGAGSEPDTPGVESGKVPARLNGLNTAAAEGSVSLGLKAISVKPGDVVSYRVRVADNRPAPRGPNVSWSDSRRLTVVMNAAPLAARKGQAERQAVQARLDALKNAAAENRHETELLRYAADAAARGNGTWDKERAQALADREAAARDVRDKLNALADDLEGDPAFAPLAAPARQAADVEAEAARDALDRAKRDTESPKRLGDLRTADARLGAVSARLEDLQRNLDQLARRAADRQKLNDLAERQADVADRAGDPASDRDRLRADQEAVRNDLDALVRDNPAMRADVLNAQADEADGLARRARDLAARQREEARQATDLSKKADALRDLADEQRAVEREARRLAADVDQPLAENGRGRLNADPLRQAADPIARGDLPAARQRLLDGENELRRLARDLDDAPADLRALAQRLARRQERVFTDTVQALGGARSRTAVPAEGRDEVVKRLQTLAGAQKELAGVVGDLKTFLDARPPQAQPAPPRDAAKAAAEAAAGAGDALQAAANPREVEDRLNRARQALQRLVNELPDPWRREEPARRAFAEARQAAGEAQRDAERLLRETERQAATDPARAAADLAARLAPVTARAGQAADRLARDAVNFAPRAEPQRLRAEGRARALAAAVEAVRAQAPPAPPPNAAAEPVKAWRLLGPFPISAAPPFDPAKPLEPARTFPGAKKAQVGWADAKDVDPRGAVDLARAFSRDPNLAAFAAAEVVSPLPRRATLTFGSDDTLAVWVNGRRVYAFDGSRSFGHDTAKVEVDLKAGPNRVVVKCGNRSDDWRFAVAVSPPPPAGFDPDRARALRDALAAAATDVRVGFERLEQKLNGQVPADDLAAELEEEHARPAGKAPDADEPDPAAEPRRLAGALRGLQPQVPDAPFELAEAVRRAEAAAAADPKARPEALRQAGEAVAALSRRLNDRPAPRDRARALAAAERAEPAPSTPGAPPPAEAAKVQHAIAAELARVEPKGAEAARDRAARAVARAADLAESSARPDLHPQPPGEPPPDHAAARAEAAAALEALAAALPEPRQAAPAAKAPEVVRDPDLPLEPEQTAKARELARRERRLRERLQAVLGERVGPQQDLRREAAALGRDLADLRDRTRSVSPRAAGPAAESASLVGEQAPRAMDEAASQLAQGQAAPARDQQRRAAELAERGAQSADDLAAALRADAREGANSGEPGRQPPAGSNPLAEAREAVAESARQLGQGNQPGAGSKPGSDPGQAARQAADRLQAAADAHSQSPGRGAQPSNQASRDGGPAKGAEASSTDPQSGPAGVATAATLDALQDQLRRQTGRRWGELPGHLRTEILQMAQGRYRDDYARLIQLYFREIAAGADRPADTPRTPRP